MEKKQLRQTYREFVSSTFNCCGGRETVEWSNFWIDSANSLDGRKQRFLLIGDSTVRMVRSTFSGVTKCAVDMLGSSSALDDQLFVQQVDAFFSNSIYCYDAIFVQLGHHGRVNKAGRAYGEDDFQKFEKDFWGLLLFLRQYSSKIIVESIFDSVIPSKFGIFCHKHHFPIFFRRFFTKTVFDDGINRITRRKNEIIKKIADRNEWLIWFDINNVMNNSKYLRIDHIHFEDGAKSYIALRMCEFV